MDESPTNESALPELFLLDPHNLTADALDQIVERVTGRKVTAEEHARGVSLVQEWNARRAGQEHADDRP
jgi:hypothetical protein